VALEKVDSSSLDAAPFGNPRIPQLLGGGWRILQHQWGSGATTTGPEEDDDMKYRCCEYCAILPINNGNEARGESLVANFEMALFHGSPLLRLRHAEGRTTQTLSDDTQGYFAGKPSRYQTVVPGRFTSELPFIGRRSGRTDHSRTILDLTGVAYPISNPLERAPARKGHFDQFFLAKRADK
jgi:hypothetical protein